MGCRKGIIDKGAVGLVTSNVGIQAGGAFAIFTNVWVFLMFEVTRTKAPSHRIPRFEVTRLKALLGWIPFLKRPVETLSK